MVDQIEKVKKKAWLYAIVATVFYAPLFPIATFMALFSFMIFGTSDVSIVEGWILILLMFCIPVSMVVSISTLWVHYVKSIYSNALFYAFLPISTFFCVAILAEIVRFCFRVLRC